MTLFPTWMKQKASTTTNNILSPRQIANKTYTLAIKKLDKDNKSCKPHYSVREKLLLSNAMVFAEEFLNKRTPRSSRRVLAFEDEYDDTIQSVSKQDDNNSKSINEQAENQLVSSCCIAVVTLVANYDSIAAETQQQQEFCRPATPLFIPTSHSLAIL
ncbi:MAG: hypothetical protein EXX96DRAFT_362188 [Benjaminiella poitrasii]|nr:MAG: hypothetical protein EXX96DRAFT_362188 [Benjaminiella poitrasii]